MAYELTDTMTDAAPNHRMTRSSEALIQAMMTDIQKATDELSHMSSFDDSPNVDGDGDSWPKAISDVVDTHVPLRPTTTSTNNNLGNSDIYEAFPNNHEPHRRVLGEDKDDYRKFVLTKNAVTKAGLHSRADASQLPFPRNGNRPTLIPMATNSDASPPSAGPIVSSTAQTFNSQNEASLLPWSPASSISHSHRYSISRASFSTSSLPSGTRSATFPYSGDHRCAHPACWTVQETVDWLRSKGFEDAVCQRFVEQEIAGDALLDLDVNKLKTEIGIVAYGKRVRIESAITECRRLAKVMSSSAIQPMRPESSSQVCPPQLTALERASLRSASVGNLPRSKSAPDSGDLRRSTSVPAQKSTKPAEDPGEQSTDDKPDPTIGLRLWVSSLLSSGGGQGETTDGRTSRLSMPRHDGVTSPNAKAVVIEQEEKGDLRERSDNDAKRASCHDDDKFDSRNASSPPINVTSPQSMELRRLLPQVMQNVKRSQSLREWRKNGLNTLFQDRQPSPSGSTLVGIFPKRRRRYFGGGAETPTDTSRFSMSHLSHDNDVSKSSALSVVIDDDSCYQKEYQRDSNHSSSSDRGHMPPLKTVLSSGGPFTGLRTEAADSVPTMFPGILARIGTPDHEGWMRKKGGYYNSWKKRYFVLKGKHLYWLRSNSVFETKVEGHVNTIDYRIIPDENINPGRYGFKLEHESNPPHFLSSDDKTAICGWITALLKLKIDHDHAIVTALPDNIPVIPLSIAQALNPSPRPPSPGTQEETQRVSRRENSIRIRDFFRTTSPFTEVSASTSTTVQNQAPIRPQEDIRRKGPSPEHPFVEPDLIEWANGHLQGMQITSKGSICSRFELLRIAQSIKNMEHCTIPDSRALSGERDDDVLEGLFSLVGLLLDKGVETDGVEIIEDMRQGNREEVIKLLKALRTWEQHRAVHQSPAMSPLKAGSSLPDDSRRGSLGRIDEELRRPFSLFSHPRPCP